MYKKVFAIILLGIMAFPMLSFGKQKFTYGIYNNSSFTLTLDKKISYGELKINAPPKLNAGVMHTFQGTGTIYYYFKCTKRTKEKCKLGCGYISLQHKINPESFVYKYSRPLNIYSQEVGNVKCGFPEIGKKGSDNYRCYEIFNYQ